MKALFLTVLFCAQTVWASGAEVKVGSAQPEQFKFEIKENPLEIGITKGDSKEHIVKMKYSISDAAKINVQLNGENGQTLTQELLLVVLSVGNAEQEIHLYAPFRTADIVLSSKINPVCVIKNYGDFSWENDQELKSKLRMVRKIK